MSIFIGRGAPIRFVKSIICNGTRNRQLSAKQIGRGYVAFFDGRRNLLSFHQREIREGIIQHLELREHRKRRDVQVRDIGNQTSPDARVEMTVRTGDQVYAIERAHRYRAV